MYSKKKLLDSSKPLVSFMERTPVETLLDMRNGFVEFFLFPCQSICKTLRVQ